MTILFAASCLVLVILVVQPLGRLVNSLDRIEGGLQLMGSRFCGPLSALDRVTLSVLFCFCNSFNPARAVIRHTLLCSDSMTFKVTFQLKLKSGLCAK